MLLLLVLCLSALCLSATIYYSYAIYAACRFFSQRTSIDPTFHPPISILKPISGIDRQAYENLASFCNQDYPEYQIIFGVQDWDDPGLAVVQQVMADFPQLDLQLVVSDRAIGTHRKVNNLANALAKAKHEILLLADSDVHVAPDYLSQVVQPLKQSEVGVVTCLYRSRAEGWLTNFEALSSATEFHPGVLVSNQLEGIKFAMGQTILIRRSVLETIGGFEAIADYLADDFQLGHLPTQAGYKVVLSHYVIEHVMATSTMQGAIQRQLRWLVGIRASRSWGYAGLIFTYGTVSSLLLLLVTEGSYLGWAALSITWAARLGMAWLIGVKCLQDPVAQRFFWLVPLRDCVSVVLWGYGFIGNSLVWHGRQFRLTRGGKLIACPPRLTEQKRIKSVIG